MCSDTRRSVTRCNRRTRIQRRKREDRETFLWLHYQRLQQTDVTGKWKQPWRISRAGNCLLRNQTGFRTVKLMMMMMMNFEPPLKTIQVVDVARMVFVWTTKSKCREKINLSSGIVLKYHFNWEFFSIEFVLSLMCKRVFITIIGGPSGLPEDNSFSFTATINFNFSFRENIYSTIVSSTTGINLIVNNNSASSLRVKWTYFF